jgi:hypothetical protein
MIKHAIVSAAAGILTGVLGAAAAFAQTEPLRELCVDRPGKDTPPCIVDKGHVLVETGAFLYSRDDETDTSEYEFGETLVRFGVTDTAELQLGWTPYSVVRLRDETTGRRRTLKGVGDLTGAVKVNFSNPDGSGTSVSAQAFVTAPTGSNGIGAGAWEGGLVIPIAFELSDKVGLTLDPEIDVRGNESSGGHHLAYVGVVSLSRDLGSGFEGSAEIWSMVDHDPAGHTTEASFDVSLSWTPKERSNLQFDAEFDLGLTSQTPDVQAAAGVAYRF